MPEDWSRDEVELIVADYFAMLHSELGGQPYSKTAHRAALRTQLQHRSDGSIEFKHANISAVLVGFGVPYIDGYKPRGNYQQLLEAVVLEYLAGVPDFFAPLLDSPVLNPVGPTASPPSFTAIVQPPPERLDSGPRVWNPNARVVKIDFVKRDAENRRLGRLGEEFVLEIEKKRLHDVEGRADLSKRIEWTAQERGDGAGYDIASFNGDGSRRYIEVKTTGLGKAFPFFVTANEVRCSEALKSEFHLYRLFRFSKEPGLYVLPGALSQSCALDVVQYQARFE